MVDVDDLVIWWLSPDELRCIETRDKATWIHEWVWREVASATGRNARGRLWVAPEIQATWSAPVWPDSALGDHLGNCAGIVIERWMVERLVHYPGIFTDMQVRRLPL